MDFEIAPGRRGSAAIEIAYISPVHTIGASNTPLRWVNASLPVVVSDRMSFQIEYRADRALSAAELIDVFRRSTLGERRPIDDLECMEGMVRNAPLMVTAWHEGTLVGVARSVTDYCYACYLSDLAVDTRYQRTGIGRALVEQTLKAVGPRCKIRLIAAPAAADYYGKIGFVRNDKCWELGHPE